MLDTETAAMPPETLTRQDIRLLGAGLELGAASRGTLMGPDALRTAGLVRVLSDLGHRVTDCGSLHEVPPAAVAMAPALAARCRHLEAIAGWTRAVHDRAFEMARGRRGAGVPRRRPLDLHGVDQRRRPALRGDRADAGGALARRPCRLQHAGDDAERQPARHGAVDAGRRAEPGGGPRRPAARSGGAGAAPRLRGAVGRSRGAGAAEGGRDRRGGHAADRRARRRGAAGRADRGAGGRRGCSCT